MRSQDLKLPDDVLQHVVIGNLRHSLSLFKCAAMSLEALRSYRLVEAKICDLEMTWRKLSKRAASQLWSSKHTWWQTFFYMNACVWDGSCDSENITTWRCILHDLGQWGAALIQNRNWCCVLQSKNLRTRVLLALYWLCRSLRHYTKATTYECCSMPLISSVTQTFFVFDLAFAFGLCCKHLQTFH